MSLGRYFLQIPGPTNIPDRVLRAMDRPVPDHRGPELPPLVREIVEGLRHVFGTTAGEIVLYPGSGSGAAEASLVNTLSPGDRVLAFNSGFFSHLFAESARRLGMAVDEVDLPWSRGVPADLVHERLRADAAGTYRAVLLVHNETSTGVTSDVRAIGEAMREAGHPALLLVDTVSSLGSIDFQFDAWGVDVALTGSQKGLMLPPGMALLCVGPRALAAGARATSARAYFDWRPILEEMRRGYFTYTPATLLLYGLRESLRMLREEGLPQVYARHARLADAVRRAVKAWGLQILCEDLAAYSNSLTTVVTPDGANAEAVLRAAERLSLSLGAGLGPLRGRAFRIGHLGALGDLEVLATIGGTEMALRMAGVSVPLGAGLVAAQDALMAYHLAPRPTTSR